MSLARTKCAEYRKVGKADVAARLERGLNQAQGILNLIKMTGAAGFERLVSEILQHTYVYWELVRQRDDKTIYLMTQEYPSVKEEIRLVYDSGVVTPADLKLVWRILDGLIRQTILATREIRAHNPQFYPNLDVAAAAAAWNV